jgi:RNA polymerase sigma-70 factor (ECF subfamily)
VAQLNREEEWAALMRAAIDGDEASYRLLLESLSRSLRAATRRGFAQAGAALNDVEDVVQETLLAIHLKRHTWNSDQPLGPWVRAIARHKLIDALRRRGRRTEVPIEAVLDFLAAEEPRNDLDRQDAARLVDGLRGRQHVIVRAISIEGQSIREVADRMGMNEGAVRVALHRGLKALAAMHREGHEE